MWVGTINVENVASLPVTVVELNRFARDARRVFSDREIAELKMEVAANPTAGNLIEGTGGVRKLRWEAEGKGKSHGARVIYFYHNQEMPIFLLAVYKKSEKVNITKQERNHILRFVRLLVAEHERSDRHA